jgi:hypothetical protein
MDRLEEYIRKNRSDLDKYDPSNEIWKGIDNTLTKKNRKIYKWQPVAATIFILTGISIILFLIANRNTSPGSETVNNDLLIVSTPQLKETEIYYNNLIMSLYNEATPMLTGNPEIETEINADFSKLDSIYADIKKDLKDNISNEEVMEALIQNYRLKIRMLEEMLVILRESETDQENKESHEL